MAATVLRRIGMEELVAGSEEELVASAVSIASNATRRSEVKAQLLLRRRLVEWAVESELSATYNGAELRRETVEALAVKSVDQPAARVVVDTARDQVRVQGISCCCFGSCVQGVRRVTWLTVDGRECRVVCCLLSCLRAFTTPSQRR